MVNYRLLSFLSILPLSACSPNQDTFLLSDSPQSEGYYQCGFVPACDAAPPFIGEAEGFKAYIPRGRPIHRGHDLFLKEGQEQWIIGRFSYGNIFFQSSLKSETVDIYLLRGCGDQWEKLGSAKTSRTAGRHPSVEGIEDNGGRIYFKIPADRALELGRHRVRLVVRGDHSAAEMFIEVLPKGTPLFVSDIDGTLTTHELEDFVKSIFTSKIPAANQLAASTFDTLVSKGYRPFYLTARPEPAVQRTREFLETRDFPAGGVETSLVSFAGLPGRYGVDYKTAAIQRLQERGFEVVFAFGNSSTDARAYENVAIPHENRFFFQYDDVEFGGVRFDDYAEHDKFEYLDSFCEAT